MPITITQVRKLNAVRLVSRKDSAIDHDNSDWDLYDEDPIKNADALTMNKGQEPTVFVCNFDTTGKEGAKIKNSLVAGVDDDKNAKISMGDWQYTVIRICLKDIQNPPNVADVIEFKKDGNGYVADKTMDFLEKVDLISELFAHYTTLTSSDEQVRANAKN
jgi:hypothetical protein